MISRRTLLVVLLVVFLIDMIQAGVFEDFGEAIHFEDIKKFTKDAAKKTGDAATSAYNNVKNYFTPSSESNIESMMKKS